MPADESQVIASLETKLAEARAELAIVKAQLDEALRRLLKYRPPKPNAARDARIMQLDLQGMTSGQIAKAMKAEWPELSEHKIRSVLSRGRKKLAAIEKLRKRPISKLLGSLISDSIDAALEIPPGQERQPFFKIKVIQLRRKR
jgi:DNA-directed RNA polymerase specialized sigma24 family protein